MRIGLAGLGMAGAYLYKLLIEEGFRVDIYEVRKDTRCGLHPCAWGTSSGFSDLVREVGLDPDDYILKRFDRITLGDVKVPTEIMTFDKPRLVNDLSESATVYYAPLNPKEYDRVIDATGVARAFLPPIKNDVIIKCKQRRLVSNAVSELMIKPGGGGYMWCFPLGGNEAHVGCGSLYEEPDNIIMSLMSNDDFREARCGCSSMVRLTGPSDSRPFFVRGTPEVWGVGEAIGCVGPLAGDGVITGMTSAKILLHNWGNPEGYTEAILKEFRWMEKERKVVDKIAARRAPDLIDALIIHENSKRMGIRIRIVDALRLVRGLL